MVERARALHPDLRVSVADAVAIPERDGSVDAIIVAALLTSIPNPETHRAIVQELRRVLRHDGTVHGVEFLRQDGMSYLNGGKVVSKADIAMWHFQPSELEQLFSAFANWRSRPVVTETLTGTPATVLQFVAHAA
jgi:ubiquinone/menaquinone biosynthesis C-methylase UbiE